ncbi:calcium-translocating P-type ATPase, SERCA-type [uncultured Peptoniphilus sp.]|uniref:calcium-translocating P-type ATPase, SERCA-type n=1 Tax=uncultured Peptoniphilus sp. TaxID=254354 RepID=UPI0028056DE7|nr:calcium-translocating P-type ATPase, SERCA-type [uncultured Peptoniphilus sp.]
MDKNFWYKHTSEDALDKLNSNLYGLSDEEVQKRLSEYGDNALKKEEKKSIFEKLKEQFLDPMIIILLAAATVSYFVAGEKLDSLIILVIVILNAALSIYQEGKAEDAISSLQKMSSPNAKVIRSGKSQAVNSEKIVPGDIVILETGDIVPADLRLIESSNLKIDESSLTGESVPVEKHAEEVYEKDIELGDRKNLAYSSTIVSYGRGKAVVIETGQKTEIGKIATSLSTVDRELTPLQKKLANLSKVLGILVIIICLVVLGVGILYGYELLEMFMTSISLAVAAIPEGLPAIVTIVLSIGMKKMAEKNAIVKKLLAVETLGTTTIICSDKTGTLTQNEMTVKKVFVDGEVLEVSGTGYDPEGQILRGDKKVNIENDLSLKILTSIAGLTNDAELEIKGRDSKIIGDPTEGALLTLAEKSENDLEKLNTKYRRLDEIPFDSDRKMMTTFHKDFFEGKVSSFTKGAPDIIIKNSSKILIDGEIKHFTEDLKNKVLEKNNEFARDALRVLAYAYRNYNSLPEKILSEENERDMIFVGLTGMIDPARPEVKDAIRECRKAGIEPVMITGDYLETGFAIAKDLGIATNRDQAIVASELNNMSEDELREIVKTKKVFTRVSPENKVQIVKALKDNGHIVAMTGDGVNDAPAIKRADIGISMGITGTDVAKNTSDVILTDDNFATIVNAVKEGRIIYSNIKKFVTYLLSCNIGEVLIVFLSIIFKLPVPLIPIQLLWLNLVTDSFPALALGVEKGEDDIMEEPSRDPDEPIIDREISITLFVQSISISLAVMGVYVIGLRFFGMGGRGLEMARSMAFTSLILCELLRSFSARSIDKTIFKTGIFSNKLLLLGVGASFILTLLVLYVPFLEEAFHLVDLDLREWIVVICASSMPLILGEVQKIIRFSRKNKSK